MQRYITIICQTNSSECSLISTPQTTEFPTAEAIHERLHNSESESAVSSIGMFLTDTIMSSTFRPLYQLVGEVRKGTFNHLIVKRIIPCSYKVKEQHKDKGNICLIKVHTSWWLIKSYSQSRVPDGISLMGS